MAPGGALTLHIGSPFSHPQRVRSTLANLRAVFPVVVPYFAYIPIYGSYWGFASASDSLDPSRIEPAEVERVMAGLVAVRQAPETARGFRGYHRDGPAAGRVAFHEAASREHWQAHHGKVVRAHDVEPHL